MKRSVITGLVPVIPASLTPSHPDRDGRAKPGHDTYVLATSETRKLRCASCGTAFECKLDGGCWCADESFRLPVPAIDGEDCLCPACLRTRHAAVTKRP